MCVRVCVCACVKCEKCICHGASCGEYLHEEPVLNAVKLGGVHTDAKVHVGLVVLAVVPADAALRHL